MRIFSIDFDRLRQLFTPIFMRDFVLLNALLSACCTAVEKLYNALLAFRTNIAQSMSYSSQTCRLRGMLNDLYDPAQRRITVNNTVNFDYLNIYTVAEALPVMVAQVGGGAPAMICRVEVVGGNSDFDVNLPDDIYSNGEQVSKVRASIDKHKLATRYYRIV